MSLSTLILFLLATIAYSKYLEGERLITFNNSDGLKIGFGSCYDEYQKGALLNNNIMRDIANESLDLWLWLGDFAYVDNKSLIG